MGPPTSGGWTAPTALPRLSPASCGFSPPDARPPAPRRHGPSPTGHTPAPAVADRRAQSRFLSFAGGQSLGRSGQARSPSSHQAAALQTASPATSASPPTHPLPVSPELTPGGTNPTGLHALPNAAPP